MSVGADLGRYRLISRIGSGGMATVELAEDTLLGRRVALKRMWGTVDVSGLARLRREALAGASLNHPNIVSVYDILTLEDGDLVIVMEYVEGETLGDRLARRGALPPSEALPLLGSVAAGLDAIHGAGIVHRDVKPSNILLGDDGAVKIADLGVASTPEQTRLTMSGSIIGSLSYMAPEQLEEGPITPAIDVYAFAAVAFEVLSGVKAREASNPVALAHAIATRPAPSLSDAWPAAPPGLTDVLRRGMARDPRARPASAGEVVAGLKSGFSAQPPRRAPRVVPAAPPPIERRPPPPVGRRPPPLIERDQRALDGRDDRGRWLLAALALGLVCVAVLAVLLNQGSSPAPKPAASGAKTHKHASASHSASTPQATHTASHSATSTPSSTSTPASTSTSTATSSVAAAGSSTTAAGSTAPAAGGAPPSTASAATPVGAVESFYRLAAARQYPQAWALADPAFRSQLGGYRSFQQGQANDRSITFDSARVTGHTPTASTVAVRTTSVQSTGTRHCAGTVDLAPGTAGGWLLHQISINCS